MTQLDATYGSDASGLVWGFRFAPDEPPRSVDSDEAAALFLASANAPPGRFVWLHLSLSNAAAHRWLRERMTLPDEFLTFAAATTVRRWLDPGGR